jgi:hypothetical protein
MGFSIPGGLMVTTRMLLALQQLDEIGGEPLDGSGFEDETPDPTIDTDEDAAKIDEVSRDV